MQEEVPQFGVKKEGVEYTPRPGAYAIIRNSDGCFAVIEGTRSRYFLVGGGLEEGESVEEGLRREVMEEMGRKIRSAVFVGHANGYVDADDGYWNKMGSFYEVELEDSSDEKSHGSHDIVRWVTLEEFRTKAAHEFQVWAVENL